MLDPSLAGAFIDGTDSDFAPRRVMGVRLLKFSLWHRFLLKSINSPFLSGERIEFQDIETAISICRVKYPSSRLRRPSVRSFLCKLIPSVRSLFGDSDAYKRMLELRYNQFLEYCGDYLQKPEYSIIPQQVPEGASPAPVRGAAPDDIEHVVELIGYGFQEDAAWNLPVGKANWHRAFARRARGLDVDFSDEEEREFQSQLPEEYRIKKQ